MALALLAPHGWDRENDQIEARCPECESPLTHLTAVDFQAGTLDLLCFACGYHERVELIGWMGLLTAAIGVPVS